MENTPSAHSINPFTHEQIASYPRLGSENVTQSIDAAYIVFKQWKETPFTERSRLLHDLAALFRTNKRSLAELITREMGKMIDQAEAEIEKCAWVCEYYADNGAPLLGDEPITTEGLRTYVKYQPLGIILAIMPWNFPFYQVIRFLAPTLMAGNVALLKHASNVQGCAERLELLLKEAGFPDAVFQNLNIESSDVEAVIAHEHVAGVTLTGSEEAGKAVASLAGRHLKKSVLELGGSDPYIILADVDLDQAVKTCMYGRLQNNGQTCIAAKRFIVVEAIYEDFIDRLSKAMLNAPMGDPMNTENYYGPMSRHDLRDELHEQVKRSIAQGARAVIGAMVPDMKGAFYPATILADVRPGMEAFDEELFGPVASVICAKDVDDAVSLANRSRFGLGSGVMTNDIALGERIAARIESGNCFVNKLTASDPRIPFGGIKHSGYGRELSHYGLRTFTNVKTVWVESGL